MKGIIAVALLVAGIAVASVQGCEEPEGAEPAGAGVEQADTGVRTGLDPVEREAFAPVVALFDAMRAGDTAALAATFHPDARLNTTAVREGRPVVGSSAIDDFIRSVGGTTSELDERLGPAEIRIDGDLATAWTPYAFFVDGEFSHCGVNAFHLVRTGAGWQILQITDTRRTDACPDGAPR